MLDTVHGASDPETRTSGAHKSFRAQRLKSFVERIERLEAEKKALAADIAEVYSELKSAGYDARVTKKVVAMRRIPAEQREQDAAVLGIYLEAVKL